MYFIGVSHYNVFNLIVVSFMLVVERREFFKDKILGRSPEESFFREFIFVRVGETNSYEVIFVKAYEFAPEQKLFKLCIYTIIE